MKLCDFLKGKTYTLPADAEKLVSDLEVEFLIQEKPTKTATDVTSNAAKKEELPIAAAEGRKIINDSTNDFFTKLSAKPNK